MYQKGLGVPQDYVEAVKWYRFAAEQRYAPAQNNLAGMYQQGLGVPQDFAEAVRLYRHAADQGETLAQNNLGIMYATGQGIPQDHVQAYMWFSLSVSLGNQVATANRDKAVEFMNQAQIAAAEKLAREWRPQPVTGPSILIRPAKAAA